ncbi:MAG: hypothetical protein AMK69_06575 [Nitrospira bacterium SG8_3]|nr:MAG: hypothetical protein AMK69_06575 [Nitrospira bacterium SG8_3]
MADILCFSRNRCTSVEQMDENTMRSSCRLQDTLTDAVVEVMVKIPDLEVMDVSGEMRRSVGEQEIQVVDALKKVIGIRVGPGMRKIIKGLIGKSEIERQLAFMVEECCEAVILTFTKDVLLNAPKDKLKEREFFENMVRSNPRLYNSCAALAPGSPLVEGIKPE